VKIRKRKDDIIEIDFADFEKELLNYVDKSMLHSWSQIIGSSLDETMRLLELTCKAQMAAAKRIEEKRLTEANEFVDTFVDDLLRQITG